MEEEEPGFAAVLLEPADAGPDIVAPGVEVIEALLKAEGLREPGAPGEGSRRIAGAAEELRQYRIVSLQMALAIRVREG